MPYRNPACFTRRIRKPLWANELRNSFGIGGARGLEEPNPKKQGELGYLHWRAEAKPQRLKGARVLGSRDVSGP